MLESCFSPYRLHPVSPLALLKFYSKEVHLPTSLPPRGIYSSTLSEVREMQIFGPQGNPAAQQQQQQHRHQSAGAPKIHFQQYHYEEMSNSSKMLLAQKVLARANTLGASPSYRPAPVASQIICQRAATLGLMPSQALTPNSTIQQNHLARAHQSCKVPARCSTSCEIKDRPIIGAGT